MMVIISILYLAFIIFIIASMWKIFTKAGKPGWAAIVPIYNIIVLLEIIKKPWWWILMLLVPIANIIFAIRMIHGLSVAFGKETGFTLGLIFLGFIFYPILGFGDAQYQYGDKVLEEDKIISSDPNNRFSL